MLQSEALFARAKKVIPGGVNSPVRAFEAVGGTPRFISRARGAKIYDEDENGYTDYVGSWGPMILGHNHPSVLEAVCKAARDGLSFGAATRLEVEMAELFCDLVPCADMVRMVNSGTEAVMSAVRTARGFTKRNKVVKFDGCYHGHSDGMLIRAGSGVMTTGNSSSAGVPGGCTRDTVGVRYNDIDSVRDAFRTFTDEIAAVVIEPVAANMGVVLPEEGFLRELRDVCHENGALLIFDEVITGFRLGLGGAQEYYGVLPDMATFGKIIGGGMPVGAYCGKREIMSCVSPCGGVYQAGTLSGNPVAMAAGIAQLRALREDKDFYARLNALGDEMRAGLAALFRQYSAPYCVNGTGSLSCVFFTECVPQDYSGALLADTEEYANYFAFMLDHGIYLAPSQFEAMFLSGAHTRDDIDDLLDAAREYLEGKQWA